MGFFLLLAAGSFVYAQDSQTAKTEDAVHVQKPDAASFAIQSLTVGIDGAYKNGFRTPLTLEIQGPASDQNYRLVAESVDSDGTPTLFESPLTISAPQTPVSVSLLFSSGRENAPLTISILPADSEEILFKKTFSPKKSDVLASETSDSPILFPAPIFGNRPLWLTVGGASEGIAAMLEELHLEGDRKPYFKNVPEFNALPEDSDALEGVDLIILNAERPEFYQNVSPDSSRLRAIQEWTKRGGRILLCGGANANPLLKSDGILAPFVPGKILDDSPREIRIAHNLVQFVPKAKNLVMLGTLDSPYLYVPELKELPPDAVAELTEDDIPLLVRRPWGLGSTVFFAADPDSQPLAPWNGRNGLLIKVLGPDVDKLTAAYQDSSLIQLGYDNLTGQLRSSLDRFRDIKTIPFSAVLALTALFLLVIGPFDWFLNHRVFKKPNLTWVTFPSWLILFSLAAVLVGKQIRPDDLRVNQVDLIDVDYSSSTIRASSWIGFFSPQDARYHLTLSPVLPDSLSSDASPKTYLSWLGLMGSGLGGMTSKTVSLRAWVKGYQIQNDGILRDFPIQTRSTKSLYGDWILSVPALSSGTLTDQDGRLRGEVASPFKTPIQDGILFYNNQAFLLGTVAEEGREINAKTPKTDDIQRLLLGSINPFALGLTDSEENIEWPEYFSDSTDPAAIIRAICFYQQMGGMRSVRLANTQQGRLDGSELYQSGRAVLFGRLPAESDLAPPACRTDLTIQNALTGEEISLDSGKAKNRRSVFVRCFIPVRQE